MDLTDNKSVCEEKLFNEVFRTQAKDLYQFLYYKFGQDNNPQDLVQEAFVKLWNNCHKVPLSKARSFLFTVANNQMLSNLSRKKTAMKYAAIKPATQDIQSPHFLMEEKEYGESLQSALAELSEEQRVAFLLNRIEGKKHKEIAEMLGISKKAVEKRIYTALAKLREKVDHL